MHAFLSYKIIVFNNDDFYLNNYIGCKILKIIFFYLARVLKVELDLEERGGCQEAWYVKIS